MAITANSARAETASPHGEPSAYIDINKAISGYAIAMRFSPALGGHYALATRKDDQYAVYLIALPSERWLGDLKDDGYEVFQTITKPAETTP